jgi:hypothetical protein
MNKQPIRGEPGGLAEEQIAEYLSTHPEFFERHGSVLARLKLPHHQRGTAAISLVERQVLVLREKHAALEKKLHERSRTAAPATRSWTACTVSPDGCCGPGMLPARSPRSRPHCVRTSARRAGCWC